jgi:3-phenylpropionate/trans-cinnamate dioxygenase ferredoxin reductase subunit
MRETFLVVGASLAGGTAAATLREDGFGGRLVLLGDEPLPPYERPGLSKGYLRGEGSLDDVFVRDPNWWEVHEVEARFGERAVLLDPTERSVVLEGGQRIAYDRALIATGVRNRRLEVPGVDLPGVHFLRTAGDAEAIRQAAGTASRVVVVGMGFIGAEVAASLRQMGLEVTIVEIFETALYRILGVAIGRLFEEIHRDHGVRMLFGDTVERFEGVDHVERVVTRAGRMLDCDLVVVGVGTEPNAELMRGEAIASDGGVLCDAELRTPLPGVFAAGDIATHDHPVFGPVRVEHFDNALKMGERAARAMLGDLAPFDDPHWFWSDQYEHGLQMAGVAVGNDPVVRGSLEERRFCAFFLGADGSLRSAVSVDWPRDVRRALPMIRAGVRPDRVQLADPDIDLRSLGREP